MSKTFSDVFDEIKAEVSGKSARTFSKADFDRMAKALVNDVDHTVEVASVKGGEMQLKEVKPVAAYRKTLQRILQDFGVDKHESARVLESSYEIASVDGLYELASELIYKYIEAGKKFDFLTRKDFKGSLQLAEVAEATTEHKLIGQEGTVKVKKEKHNVLKAKSSTPNWLKTKLK